MKIIIPRNYQSLLLPDREWLRFLGVFYQGNLRNVPIVDGFVAFGRIAPDDLRRCPPRPTDVIPSFDGDFFLKQTEIRLLMAARHAVNGFFPRILVQHGKMTDFTQPQGVMHMK